MGIRRGLFGQSLVDFSTDSWSSIQLKESARSSASTQEGTQPNKTPRLLRVFGQSRAVAEKKLKDQPLVNQPLLPGMSQYSDDVEMEDFSEAEQDSAAISQRCEFFELSPK